MRALLDVNVLIALLDSDHAHNEFARRWMEGNIGYGWATCTITQNGVLRIMSRPNYERRLRAASIATLLEEAIDTRHHEFWPGESILSPGAIDWRHIQGPKQITDVYLLALAAKNNGRLVTFDRRIAKNAVPIAADETYCAIPTP